MARYSRTRFSRSVVSIVVILITIGAALQFKKLRKASAETPPPLSMSVSPSNAPVTPVKMLPQAVAPPLQTITPVVKTLFTQTPDPAAPKAPLYDKAQVPVTQVTPATPIVKLSAESPSITPPSNPASNPASNPGTVISDANSKVAAGDLIGARTLLNNALVSGSLSPADADAVKKQMAQINQTLIFSPRQFHKDPLGGVYVVKSGDRMAAIGNAHLIPYELLLPLNRMTDARKLRYGQVLKVINGPFFAVVTKSKFTLDVYLGGPGGPDSTYITTFMVGLGTDNSTPTGTWTIKNKVTHPAYFPPEGHEGPVLAPDDPKNPLGAYWMGLEGTDGQAVGQRSYGIHGTIDPTSIGKQSSMGCIRLKNEDVEQLYKLLMVGKSTVIVRD